MIITRLAPSPTGKFHIGTARTALFAWLFARKNNGKFLLRVEDTDIERSKKEYVGDILEGMKWLGLNWDGEIIYQSKRLDIYRKYVDKLLSDGIAYKKDGAIFFKIRNPKSDLPANSVWQAGIRNNNQNTKYKIQNNIISFIDLVRGEIRFDLNDDKDFVIVKSDGTPLFMISNCIDDAESGVTHVVRGEDHISNTPRQILLYSALGLEDKIPQFAHIPLIFNADHTKISKRQDPVSITDDFRDQGFLPEAMINYLALLGWHPTGEKEIFSIQELVNEFDLSRVQKSPAIFDMEKLLSINHHYLTELPNEQISVQLDHICHSRVESASQRISTSGIQRKNDNSWIPCQARNDNIDIDRFVEIVKERAKTLNDIERFVGEIIEIPDYNSEMLVFKKSDKNATKKALKIALDQLDSLDQSSWTQEKIKSTLESIVVENNFSNGDVFWSMRVALSGAEKSPPPENIAWAIEKGECIRRISDAIDKL
ncbi:MAG: nondiscriminating glutamyl-tRNA synthetase [Candidatus Berkelbacteria bacterium Licking1014_85]|uniref:Glutamate--tRNA ligase n=1 Tax=Candidatus Berkelbacteria bacterium Licking1014_85 TaxID=2017148 RepID=A0A554LJU7_9BACT|nr:MAG: nondiscriminating glutamyl-tRNA synthetase [Candidatus Berkelbacteria bacterium Licking1014_85]